MKKAEKDDKLKTTDAGIYGINIIDPELINRITKPRVRLKIFLALYLYKEMYVTEMAKLLKMDKNTISRHLNKMSKEGILQYREEKIKGRIDRKYFKLTEDYLFDIDQYRELMDFDHPILKVFQDKSPKQKSNFIEKQIKIAAFREFYNLTGSIMQFIMNGFELYKATLDSFEDKLDDLDFLENLFGNFFKSPRKIDFYPIFIAENQLEEANELIDEFSEKLLKLRKKGDDNGEQRSFAVLSSIIPMADMLKKFS